MKENRMPGLRCLFDSAGERRSGGVHVLVQQFPPAYTYKFSSEDLFTSLERCAWSSNSPQCVPWIHTPLYLNLKFERKNDQWTRLWLLYALLICVPLHVVKSNTFYVQWTIKYWENSSCFFFASHLPISLVKYVSATQLPSRAVSSSK